MGAELEMWGGEGRAGGRWRGGGQVWRGAAQCRNSMRRSGIGELEAREGLASRRNSLSLPVPQTTAPVSPGYNRGIGPGVGAAAAPVSPWCRTGVGGYQGASGERSGANCEGVADSRVQPSGKRGIKFLQNVSGRTTYGHHSKF